MQEKKTIRILKILCVILFLLIIFFQIFKSYSFPLGYDGAYQASASKNIALGYGYVTSYNGIKLFNPELSTGYPLVLPITLGVKIFSNKYWVPNFVFSSIVLALLLIVLYLPKKFDFVDEKKLWVWRTLFLSFLMFSSSLETIIKYHSELSSFLGEMPTAFLVIISTFVLMLAKDSKKLYFASGLIGGFALATKFISILSILPIFVAYLFLNCQNKNDLKAKIPHIILYLTAFAIPYAAFEIFKLVNLGGISQYLQLKAQEHEFFAVNGSGISSYKSIFKKIITNSKNLIFYEGFCRFLLTLFMPLFFTFNLIKNRKTIKPESYFVHIFMFAFAVNLYWWLPMSFGWSRHLLIGWMLLLAAISSFAFCFNNKNKYVYSIIIVLFLTLTCSYNFVLTFVNFNQTIAAHSRVKDMQQAANFISTHKEYKYFGCDWWVARDLEYILPTVNNFSDARDTTKFNDKIHNKALVINAHFWDWESSSINNKIKNQCLKGVLFSNENYLITRCD
jgi:hypothetical protein